MTNSQSKEIQPIIVPFKYIPEGVWEHIKSYIPFPKNLYEQGKEILDLFIWLLFNCSRLKKKDVALVLRGLLEKQTGDEEELRIGNPEDSLFKRTTKTELILKVRSLIRMEFNLSLCVWDTEENKLKPVKITEISPAKMAVAKSIVDMMKTIINKEPKLVDNYWEIKRREDKRWEETQAKRNQITP